MKFFITFSLTILNTVFWCLILFFFTGLKIIMPGGKLRQACSRAILFCSKNWIACNNFMIDKIAGVDVEIRWKGNISKEGQYLVIANHQSWTDILLLQKSFHNKAPFLRFFLKKQLIWLPFLGQAFWALDFPFMNRYSKEYLKKHPEKKGKDLESTIRSCHKFAKIPFSLINFPEGTRFTKEKYQKQKPNFSKLLKPKAGGTAFALESFEGNIRSLIDVTIFYPEASPHIVDFMNGKIKKVIIELEERKIPDHFGKCSYLNDPKYREEFQDWLNQIWLEKDNRLSKLKNEAR
ncbi:MAG: acyltransferase [Bdellovibrionota bacterium]